jgi:phospholipid transport system substrate-binding protein
MTPHATRRTLLSLVAAARWVTDAPLAVAEMGGPATAIGTLNEALLRLMHAGRTTPFAERAGILTPAIQGAFDLRQILQTSVGLRWSSFTPEQQADLLAVFTRYTVASYVANFDSFSGERFEILPRTRAVGQDQIVQTKIVPASGEATPIDYVMRSTDAGWKAIDVLLDGSISRVAVQRSDFRSLLAGGTPERLIASLRSKSESLESGARP